MSEVYLGKLEVERNIISLTNSFCGQQRSRHPTKSWSSCCRVMYFWCRRRRLRRSRQRKRKHLTKFSHVISRENVVSLERLAAGLVLIIKMINPLLHQHSQLTSVKFTSSGQNNLEIWACWNENGNDRRNGLLEWFSSNDYHINLHEFICWLVLSPSATKKCANLVNQDLGSWVKQTQTNTYLPSCC